MLSLFAACLETVCTGDATDYATWKSGIAHFDILLVYDDNRVV